MTDIRIFPDRKAMTAAAAEYFIQIAAKAIEESGRSSVALAGGSTPKALYEMLAGDEYRERIDWQKMLFVIGDERNVPPDDERSNYGMAERSLLRPLSISDKNIVKWKTANGEPEQIAERFENEIKDAFSLKHGELPRFDIAMLGMGADGHTASLFPGTKALTESERIAVENDVPQLGEVRFTLTFPVINNARNVMFLVAGADKAEAVKSVIEDTENGVDLPAGSVRPSNGTVTWFLDEAAARLLMHV
ncbi:MAG: 6-phosphogluconolactonase [Acidobacteria bacterium]|nr:6-phosphogluconolactonase [Acidobacteriota bacterium]